MDVDGARFEVGEEEWDVPLAATVRGWPRLLLSWPSHNILFPVSDVLPPARHGGAAARCTPATLSCGSGVICRASVSELEPQKRLLFAFAFYLERNALNHI